MAHQCPNCSNRCHCGGDIDDLCLGEGFSCTCCDSEDSPKDLREDGNRLFIFFEEGMENDHEFEVFAHNHINARDLAVEWYGDEIKSLYYKEKVNNPT